MTVHERLLSDALGHADIETLEALAAYHENIARRARRLVARRRGDQAMRQRTGERLRFLDQLPDVVATYAQSMSLDQAIRTAAQATGVPEQTVAARMRIRQRRQAHEARAARDATISRLMREGRTDHEIAALVRVHVSTVRRALKGEPRLPAAPPKPVASTVSPRLDPTGAASAVREPPALAAAE